MWNSDCKGRKIMLKVEMCYYGRLRDYGEPGSGGSHLQSQQLVSRGRVIAASFAASWVYIVNCRPARAIVRQYLKK